MKRVSGWILALLAFFLMAGRATAYEPEDVIGTLITSPNSMSKETPYCTQCQYGTVAADAVRTAAGTDIALVNIGDIHDGLHQGEITWADLETVIETDQALAVAEITPAELFQVLEHSVSVVTVSADTEQIDEELSWFDGFSQVSGITFRYEASAPAGERVMSISLADGTALDADDTETVLTLCATEYMLSGGYGYTPIPFQRLNITLREALRDYIRSHSELPEDTEERIDVVGARKTVLTRVLTRRNCLLLSAVLIVFCVVGGTRYKAYQEEYRTRRRSADRF